MVAGKFQLRELLLVTKPNPVFYIPTSGYKRSTTSLLSKIRDQWFEEILILRNSKSTWRDIADIINLRLNAHYTMQTVRHAWLQAKYERTREKTLPWQAAEQVVLLNFWE